MKTLFVRSGRLAEVLVGSDIDWLAKAGVLFVSPLKLIIKSVSVFSSTTGDIILSSFSEISCRAFEADPASACQKVGQITKVCLKELEDGRVYLVMTRLEFAKLCHSQSFHSMSSVGFY